MSYDTCIRVFNVGEAGMPGGQQLNISHETPIYSTYTGNIIGYGCIQLGTPTGVLSGEGYGKKYHVVECNPITGTCIAH
jgi:hypothetical protein